MWETKVYNGEKVKRFSGVFKVGLFSNNISYK